MNCQRGKKKKHLSNSQTPVVWLRPHANTAWQLSGSYGGGEGNFVEGFQRFCAINRHSYILDKVTNAVC